MSEANYSARNLIYAFSDVYPCLLKMQTIFSSSEGKKLLIDSACIIHQTDLIAIIWKHFNDKYT